MDIGLPYLKQSFIYYMIDVSRSQTSIIELHQVSSFNTQQRTNYGFLVMANMKG